MDLITNVYWEPLNKYINITLLLHIIQKWLYFITDIRDININKSHKFSMIFQLQLEAPP